MSQKLYDMWSRVHTKNPSTDTPATLEIDDAYLEMAANHLMEVLSQTSMAARKDKSKVKLGSLCSATGKYHLVEI